MTFKIRLPRADDFEHHKKTTSRPFGEVYASTLTAAFRDKRRGKCPFCGLGIFVDWDGTVAEHPAIYHDLPMCPEYDRNTADEFVQAVLDKADREGR